MTTPEFVHLHVHSEFSLLDSAIRINALVDEVKAKRMSAVALTDHNNMFGALQFFSACQKADIKPIIGCEVSAHLQTNNANGTTSAKANGKETQDPSAAQSHEDTGHLLLLAENPEGYRNLIHLVSRTSIRGSEGHPPSVSLDEVYAHRKGLVGLSACMGGLLSQSVLRWGEEKGADMMASLRDAFEPGAFYVELQDHGFLEQIPLRRILVKLAKGMGLPIVATNNCHYLTRDQASAQLALQCIAVGKPLAQMQAAHHGSEEIYVKSPEEMAARFRELPEALTSTVAIAERCAGQVNPMRAPQLPTFTIPDTAESEASYLSTLSKEGLDKRIEELEVLGQKPDRHVYTERLARELGVIEQMGYPGYFLIVQDFINWAKENDVPVGPGRGSGAGSIVAWALRITDLDPIPYDLLFERFLNPERVSMPDFDIDFCMDKRDRVIDYVREKYGRDSVGQIATFHQLKSRSVVRDVGRLMGMMPAEAGRIATLVPEPVQGRSVPIKDALEQEPRLKAVYDSEPPTKELLDTAMALENLTRHAGMHAAGVVISRGPLWDHVPVFCPEAGEYVTQYDKDDVEAAGLVKFDFLGLRTLTVIDIAAQLVEKRPERNGEPIDLSRIPLDDPATFKLLQSGETSNVFQLESSGMQSLFKQLKPDCFEDIIAAVALYRPGPLGSGMVEDFIQRKHGRVPIAYPHPCLEPILKDTYGVIVYQEQVMRIAREMAGYSLGGADLLRRAMGKKKASEMEKQKVIFLEGAQERGHKREDADKVFELMAYFAGYGFNKSHSAAYALITYQTAYLKAHYPAEFVCATLTADREKSDKVVRTVAIAKDMGLTVLPPDVNESDINFTVVYSVGETKIKAPPKGRPVSEKGKLRDPAGPQIRFGLGAIKGVGDAALDALLRARKGDDDTQSVPEPFSDLFDFCTRVDPRHVGRTGLEALVQCGAFDSVHDAVGIARDRAFAAIEKALDLGKRARSARDSNQISLFGMLSEEEQGALAPTLGVDDFPSEWAEWDGIEKLRRERSALGFFVSGHPLDAYAKTLSQLGALSVAQCQGVQGQGAQGQGPSDGTEVYIGGVVEGFRERTTKRGSRIAFFQLEDASGRIEVIVRSKPLGNEATRALLTGDDPLLITAIVQVDNQAGEDGSRELKLVLKEAAPLENSLEERAKSMRLKLSASATSREQLHALKEALLAYPGPLPVSMELSIDDDASVHLPQVGISVAPNKALRARIDRLFGTAVCELRG